MKRTLSPIRWLASIASFALFAYVLERTEPAVIFDKIQLLGWGFSILILLSGVRHGLRTLAWETCLGTSKTKPRFLELFGLRLVGEAFNDLTPAGPLVGEGVKIWAASNRVPALAVASSVIIEDAVYGLGAILFMLTGIVLALLKLAAPHEFQSFISGFVSGLILLLMVAFWVIKRRKPLVSRIIEGLEARGSKWPLLAHYGKHLRIAERSFYDFSLTRRSLFFYVLAIEFLTNFTGIGEAYLILWTTARHASLLAAYLVESAYRAVQLGFAFVPFGLGVQEGAAAATLEALGYVASEGVSLAVIRRVRTVFWVGLGLLLAPRYSASQFPVNAHGSFPRSPLHIPEREGGAS